MSDSEGIRKRDFGDIDAGLPGPLIETGPTHKAPKTDVPVQEDRPSFSVPYRCLVPNCAIGYIMGTKGSSIKEMERESGAEIHLSRELDLSLADKVISLTGTREQKKHALVSILRKLRGANKEDDEDKGMFVLIIPDRSVSMIRHEQLLDRIKQESQCEMLLPDGSIPGLPFKPVTAKGSVNQTLAGVLMLHDALEDNTNRGRLQHSDFVLQSNNTHTHTHQHTHTHTTQSPSAGSMTVPAGDCPSLLYCRIIMPNDLVSFVAGKGFSHLKDLATHTFTHITIPKHAPPPLKRKSSVCVSSKVRY
eukprot:GHVR01013884.1.p1 GENE.GHVR01013884.1~~GHVR01013884.1.p1  ORF type:complete len:305 (+),score=97.52 GHVR01013884.1:108-1022(+)